MLVEKPLLISEVISALSGEFLKLMKYRTGSLVIIKCLEVANAQSEVILLVYVELFLRLLPFLVHYIVINSKYNTSFSSRDPKT